MIDTLDATQIIPSEISALDLLGPTYRIPGVEIFEAGEYTQGVYTIADLDRTVENFYRFRDLECNDKGVVQSPPLCGSKEPIDETFGSMVAGHDEQQSMASSAGLPNFGKVDGLRRVGKKLVADFEDVPAVMALLILAGRYDTVSSEFWPNLQYGGEGFGIALRRVVVIGQDVPQVKTLNPNGLPTPIRYTDADLRRRVYRQIRPGRSSMRRDGSIVCFSEASTMSRDQMMQVIKGMNNPAFTAEFIETLTDEQMAMLIAGSAPKPPGEGEAAAGEAAAEPFTDTAAAAAAAAAAAGANPATPVGTVPAAGAAPAVVAAFTDQASRRLASIESRTAAADRMANDRYKAERKRRIDEIWQQALKAGVKLPAHESETRLALGKCDSMAVVCFSDAPKVQQTELEYMAAKILAGPVLQKFGDQMPGRAPDAEKIDPARRQRMLAATPFGRVILKKEAAAARVA